MFVNRCTLCALLLFVLVFELLAEDGPFFLKASKSVPRMGKRTKHQNNNNDENFEKFFLKASKSVPRIGRRGSPDDFAESKELKEVKYPLWSNLAELYEYNPELFSTPQLLTQLEDYGMLGDDPNQYDRIRFRRNDDYKQSQDKEIMEYRLQAIK